MSDKNQPEVDLAAGPQDFLTITREKLGKGYSIQILAPDKAPLYELNSSDIRDKTSIVVMIAQRMSRDPLFGFGRDQLPYRWEGNRWVSVERWLISLDYSMHALIRTSVNRRMTSDSLAFEALAAWQANSKYPVEGLEL